MQGFERERRNRDQHNHAQVQNRESQSQAEAGQRVGFDGDGMFRTHSGHCRLAFQLRILGLESEKTIQISGGGREFYAREMSHLTVDTSSLRDRTSIPRIRF